VFFVIITGTDGMYFEFLDGEPDFEALKEQFPGHTIQTELPKEPDPHYWGESVTILQGRVMDPENPYPGTSGAHLKAVRGWMQQNFHNGSEVAWGSDMILEQKNNITPGVIEDLAERIRAALVQGYVGQEARANRIHSLYIQAAVGERGQRELVKQRDEQIQKLTTGMVGRYVHETTVHVLFQNLPETSFSSPYKKSCPVCKNGLIVLDRDVDQIRDSTRCAVCSQRFTFVDIEEVRRLLL